MRKALLLYNPLSGRRCERRVADVNVALRILHSAGVVATATPTAAAGQAAAQVRQAMAEGCDTVFACGGDGTIHDVLQGLVGANVALGVIPLGTANVLAHDLGLPLRPEAAAKAALQAKPRRIAVGRVEYRNNDRRPAARYFIVTAGVGADAHLFYKLNAESKKAMGLASYYLKAFELWLTHPMDCFRVTYSENNIQRVAAVSQLLAVRIANFGGMLRKLAPGASLLRDDLRLVLFRTRSRWAYLSYVVRAFAATNSKVTGIDLAFTREATATASDAGARIFVEADGELLGTLPARITIVPDALTLLMPQPFAGIYGMLSVCPSCTVTMR
ncbi:MAG TPA: YegS/Rv2252/BmrU family lipid kinase [Terriglobales bacterium]